MEELDLQNLLLLIIRYHKILLDMINLANHYCSLSLQIQKREKMKKWEAGHSQNFTIKKCKSYIMLTVVVLQMNVKPLIVLLVAATASWILIEH